MGNRLRGETGDTNTTSMFSSRLACSLTQALYVAVLPSVCS